MLVASYKFDMTLLFYTVTLSGKKVKLLFVEALFCKSMNFYFSIFIVIKDR